VVSMKCPGVQSPAAPQIWKRKFLIIREPRAVVTSDGIARPRCGAAGGDAGQSVGADCDAVKAGGQLERFVTVLIHTWSVGGKPAKSGVVSSSMLTSRGRTRGEARRALAAQ